MSYVAGSPYPMLARRTVEYPSGWTCELVVLRFEHYLLRTIPYDAALAVAEHLEACGSCAQRVALHYAELPPPRPQQQR